MEGGRRERGRERQEIPEHKLIRQVEMLSKVGHREDERNGDRSVEGQAKRESQRDPER